MRVLRSTLAKKVGVQRFSVAAWSCGGTSWPSAAASALTATPTQVATIASTDTKESTPGAGRNGGEIRILYGDGGKLYCVKSTNDGTSWAAPTVAYDGGLNYFRFSNISVCYAGGASGTGGSWICVFNGYNAKGLPMVLGAHDAGSGWVAWAAHPANYGHWQVAGVRPGPEAAPDCRVYAYLWGTELDSSGLSGWNSLMCQQVQVSSSGVFSAWGTRAVVDRAGVAGAAAYDRVRFGEGGGAYLFALQERATTGYWFVASLYALPGNADMEEPVFLGDADGAAGGVATRETLQPVAGGRRAWLVGAGQVWTSAQTDAARRPGRAHLHANQVRVPGEHLWRRRAAAGDRAPSVVDALGRCSARGLWGHLSAGGVCGGYAVARPHAVGDGGRDGSRHASRWRFGWRP